MSKTKLPWIKAKDSLPKIGDLVIMRFKTKGTYEYVAGKIKSSPPFYHEEEETFEKQRRMIDTEHIEALWPQHFDRTTAKRYKIEYISINELARKNTND